MTPNWEWQQRTGTESVLVVRGDLDVAVGVEFVDAVDEALAADGSATQIVIDLGEVDFIDSSGVRALIRVRREHGDRVRLVAASHPVRRVLDIAGLRDCLGFDHDMPDQGITEGRAAG